MVRKTHLGIWNYQKLLPSISTHYHLTLGEGKTQLIEKSKIYFKCEFENPTGSVKDRGFAYQISRLIEKGVKETVLSSSGNAAISAANYTKLAGIKLTVFVAKRIKRSKLDHLQSLGVNIKKSSRPVSDSFKYAKEKNIYNLRPSLDPVGHVGYSTIAYELDEDIGMIDAVFFPVSSGTTLVGVALGFQKLGYLPKIFAVQTESIHPISCVFDEEFKENNSSIADAIVAKYTPRKYEVLRLIRKSKGSGFIVSDKEILKASKWLDGKNIDTSYEGALALAGLWKAQKNGWQFQKVVCLLTGKKYD